MESGVPGPRASLRTAQLLLLLLLVAACQGQGDVYAVVGGNVTLEAKYNGAPTEINWKVDGNRFVDMTVSTGSIHFYRNESARSSIEKNGKLTVKHLTKKDSATFRAEALIDTQYQYTDYRITVYDPVPEPTINDSSTEKFINVTCKSTLSGVTYEWWNSTGALVSSVPTYVIRRPEQAVRLTCVVRNPASENRNSVTILPITGPPYGWFALLLLVPILVVFFLWYCNCLDRVCCCFGSEENCAVSGINTVCLKVTCGKLQPREKKVCDGRDVEAPQGKTDVNDTRPEEARPLNAGTKEPQESANKIDGNERKPEVL